MKPKNSLILAHFCTLKNWTSELFFRWFKNFNKYLLNYYEKSHDELDYLIYSITGWWPSSGMCTWMTSFIFGSTNIGTSTIFIQFDHFQSIQLGKFEVIFYWTFLLFQTGWSSSSAWPSSGTVEKKYFFPKFLIVKIKFFSAFNLQKLEYKKST